MTGFNIFLLIYLVLCGNGLYRFKIVELKKVIFRLWGLICNCTPNKLFFSWAQNIPCPLIHHVSMNFIVHIAHLSFETPPTNSPYQPLALRVNVKPQHFPNSLR